ncbi:hypothetical protein PR048_017071 [Dryococelus australis]|uniref:HAT C-terminal dimerisation domain-containing protein n=1 Tax=Dryococelus australis TaxID=614101 RepID=A0ABQ9H8K5_9NEOP|nr:hypothetical protein PR048_017071 [Dryococelus australis]
MEQRRNERAGETGDPLENPPINGIVRYDSHMRKSGVTQPVIEPGSPRWEASSLSPAVNKAILASCLHPMFKLRRIPQDLNDQGRKRIHNMCILAAEQEQIASSDEADADTHISAQNEDHKLEKKFVFSSPNTEVEKYSTIELEIVSYLNNKSASMASLNQYQTVKIHFMRYNTSLCSSAPVERLFSFAGFILNPIRSLLSDHNFEKLIF